MLLWQPAINYVVYVICYDWFTWNLANNFSLSRSRQWSVLWPPCHLPTTESIRLSGRSDRTWPDRMFRGREWETRRRHRARMECCNHRLRGASVEQYSPSAAYSRHRRTPCCVTCNSLHPASSSYRRSLCRIPCRDIVRDHRPRDTSYYRPSACRSLLHKQPITSRSGINRP